jgi:integrase
MSTTRTTSGMEWNEMIGLVTRLERDQKYLPCLLIATGSFLGLRAGDLLSLKWNDIMNVDALEISEGKTGKKRRLTINPFLKEILQRISKKQGKYQPFQLDEPILKNRWGKQFSIQYANRLLHKTLSEYKVKVNNASTHTLRKTFGKRVWEMDGKSERALIYLSQIFNHSSIQITRRYIGIVEENISNIYLNL